jgi:hypothetical protein
MSDWKPMIRAWNQRGYALDVEGRAILLRHRDTKRTFELLTVADFVGVLDKSEREALAEELKQHIEEVTK